MSEQKEKSRKTKVKEFVYKAADKTGHFIRKALPYLATAATVVTVVKAITGKDDNNSTSA